MREAECMVQEAGDRKEAGGRRQEAGGRRQEAAPLLDRSLSGGNVDDRSLVTLPQNCLHDVVRGRRLATGRGPMIMMIIT